MNAQEFVLFVVVPLLCAIVFPSFVFMIQFCFGIAKKITQLDSDYYHLNNNVKQGFTAFDLKLDKVEKNIEKIHECLDKILDKMSNCRKSVDQSHSNDQ